MLKKYKLIGNLFFLFNATIGFSTEVIPSSSIENSENSTSDADSEEEDKTQNSEAKKLEECYLFYHINYII